MICSLEKNFTSIRSLKRGPSECLQKSDVNAEMTCSLEDNNMPGPSIFHLPSVLLFSTNLEPNAGYILGP